MDESRRGGVISSDKDALFSLWFHLINLRHLGVGVFGDNQGRVDIEKAVRADEADRAKRSDRSD